MFLNRKVIVTSENYRPAKHILLKIAVTVVVVVVVVLSLYHISRSKTLRAIYPHRIYRHLVSNIDRHRVK